MAQVLLGPDHTSSSFCPFRRGRKEPWFFLELDSFQRADWRPATQVPLSPTSWLLHVAQASGPGLTKAQLPQVPAGQRGRTALGQSSFEEPSQPQDILGSGNPSEHAFHRAYLHTPPLHPPPLETGRQMPAQGPARYSFPYLYSSAFPAPPTI